MEYGRLFVVTFVQNVQANKRKRLHTFLYVPRMGPSGEKRLFMKLRDAIECADELSWRGRGFYSAVKKAMALDGIPEALIISFKRWLTDVRIFTQYSPNSILRDDYNKWLDLVIDSDGIISLDYLEIIIRKLNAQDDSILLNYASLVNEDE